MSIALCPKVPKLTFLFQYRDCKNPLDQEMPSKQLKSRVLVRIRVGVRVGVKGALYRLSRMTNPPAAKLQRPKPQTPHDIVEALHKFLSITVQILQGMNILMIDVHYGQEIVRRSGRDSSGGCRLYLRRVSRMTLAVNVNRE